MVFQHFNLFPHLNIVENLALGPIWVRKVPKKEAEETAMYYLEKVHIADQALKFPGQLSGGQQQRVALARALIFEPTVLLLDEPLGALDAKLREEMKIEIKQLHNEIGATILFVTHDQEEALTLSDRIAVFNEGEIVQLGTPDELYHQPANRFVADFIGETNLLAGKVVSVTDRQCRAALSDGLEITGNLREGMESPTSWVTYTLRLEKITVGDGAANCTNQMTGTVKEFLFIGDSTKYLISLAADWDIKVKLPETGMSRHAVGDEVKVGWNANDMLLVETDVPPARAQD